MRAENGQGEGSASDEATATPLPVPSHPRNLTATAGNALVTLVWAIPTSNGGSSITGYEYRYQPQGSPFTSWANVPDSDANTTTHAVQGLTNGPVHIFELRAATATNKGAAASARATPTADAPSPPVSLSAEKHDQAVELAWTAPAHNGGSPIIRYEYRQRADEAAFGDWSEIPNSGDGGDNALNHRVTGLNNGTRYTFEIRAVNNATHSPESNQAAETPQVITTPDMPRAAQLSSGDGKVILQWLKPLNDGGRPILRHEYCLDHLSQCSATWITIPDSAIGPNGHGYLEIASSNGTYTRVKVRAVNAQGAGPSDDHAAVPLKGAPSPPSNLKVEAVSAEQVKISWTEPQARTEATITAYSLERSRDGVTWTHDHGCVNPCEQQFLGHGPQPTDTTSITATIGENATIHYRMRTLFTTVSPTLVSGIDLNDGSSPSSPVVKGTTVGAQGAQSTPALSVSDSYAHEGTNSDVIFRLSLIRPYGNNSRVSVDYRTKDVTATVGSDYSARNGTLVFAPSETLKTVSVPINDDALEDSGDSFTLLLSNVSGAVLNRSGAIGIIYNEENLISGFTLRDHASNADAGAVTDGTTITLDDPANGQYGFRANPATDAVIGSVKFELSGTKSVSRTDNDQPYTLYAAGGQGLPPGAYTLKATVYPEPDGEGPAHQTRSVSFTIAAEATAEKSQLSVADATASEETDSTIDFVVTLNPASYESVSVNYATSDGSATAGDDYTSKTGTITFNAGETTKTVQVAIIDDTVDDNNETLTLTLSNASGADINGAQATGTITNSEPAPLTATFSNVPGSHDGSTWFTFDLAFSENVKAGYRKIRDHAFTISGGDVTKAKRKVQGSNQTWTIRVLPDGNGAVTITLPETTGCDADGAICTHDSRKLSGRVELTVNGPEQQSQEQPNNPATGLPTITGIPQVDQTLAADTSAITDEDGLDDVSYRYQWIRSGNGAETDIAGATDSTYTLALADQGKTIKVKVSFTDDNGNDETLTSVATAEVETRPNGPATGLPTISGTVQVEQTLTADTSGIADEDGLTGVSYSYQWMPNNGNDDTDIDGATDSTYAVSDDDVGQTIKVRVSFTDDWDNEETLTSAATDTVVARPNSPATELPTISGTAQAGETLTADISGNQRRRRAVQRFLQPPVARRRRRDTGSHRLDLPTNLNCHAGATSDAWGTGNAKASDKGINW